MIDQKIWTRVNQELVAKAIGELTFEEIISPSEVGNLWKLSLSSGITYEFWAQRSIWEHLHVDPASLLRHGTEVTSAAQFFIDSQAETKMDDIVLGNFLEEMHNTLYSDMQLHQKRSLLKVEEMVHWDGEKLQTVQNGHPKILLNKGRIGWGQDSLSAYSPESGQPFQLHWIAVHHDLLDGVLPPKEILEESFIFEAQKSFLSRAKEKIEDLQTYSFLPVHPWQWDKFIVIQFAELINLKKIISLGIAGDHYSPQISLRTLSNVERPEKVDIKLPLTILNTSCIRGLPAKGISIGPKVSEILSRICQEDEFLNSSHTEILREKAGVAVPHPYYSQVKKAPYRYHEYLGAVWRESSRSKLEAGNKAIITASLFLKDKDNRSLIGEYIRLSGLSTSEWLQRYFKTIVLPLYHLQLEYGVGMVAHGQNIILTLRNFAPHGMILKDFQGDLRLSSTMPEKGKRYFGKYAEDLTVLPPHYLIHDLITGHFITVLRFISQVLKETENFSEDDFYQILSEEIQQYSKNKNIPVEQSLLNKTIPRVLLNKVRFSIGYADSDRRPLPLVGTELQNPLYPQGSGKI